MEITVLGEYGYEFAALGMSLSFKDRAITIEDWWTPERYERMSKTMVANAGRGKGHDKYLRQITVYMMINAPRYWWSEFDTYKVGTVAQSESTMHTLAKRDMLASDLDCDGSEEERLENAEEATFFNEWKGLSWDGRNIRRLKRILPESYLQRRLVTMNYAVLQCIIKQRAKHRLPEWQKFILEVYDQVEHPELLPQLTIGMEDK